MPSSIIGMSIGGPGGFINVTEIQRERVKKGKNKREIREKSLMHPLLKFLDAVALDQALKLEHVLGYRIDRAFLCD